MINVSEPLHYRNKYSDTLSLFLAGGIDRAPDWQKEAIAYLKSKEIHYDLDVFNPRRATPFSKEDYDSRKDQVSWEYNHLRTANVILFWFPENAPCTTSLFELGYWINYSNKVVVGMNPGHYKERSVKGQIDLLNNSACGNILVSSTLETTLEKSLNILDSLDNIRRIG